MKTLSTYEMIDMFGISVGKSLRDYCNRANIKIYQKKHTNSHVMFNAWSVKSILTIMERYHNDTRRADRSSKWYSVYAYLKKTITVMLKTKTCPDCGVEHTVITKRCNSCHKIMKRQEYLDKVGTYTKKVVKTTPTLTSVRERFSRWVDNGGEFI